MPRKVEPPRPAQDESKSARTRVRILDAAAHVLSRKGYSGTRLTDVAEVAEIQAPAIYYYFPSREDLIEEVMWAGIADMREHVLTALDAVDPEATAMDRIMVAVEEHLRHELAISDYTTASIRNAGQLPEKIRARQKAEEARYGDVWKKLIKEAAADGEIRPDLDLRIVQMLIMGALNWAPEWWNPRRGTLDTVVRNAQILVRSGIGVSAVPTEIAAAAPKRATRARKAATEKTRKERATA